MHTASKSRGLTTPQKRELWDRWKKGQTLSEIGRALGKHAGSISGVLAIHGGIAPTTRSRSARVLSGTEREEISRGLSSGLTFSRIAEAIGRSTSTVSREVHRNGGRDAYRANKADQRAWLQSKRPKKCLFAM